MAESVGDNRAFLHDATAGISVSQKKWIGGYDCVPNQTCGTLLIDAIVVLNKQTRGSFLTTKKYFYWWKLFILKYSKMYSYF